MVQFGPAADDAVPVAVASKMLTALLDREDTLFTVLLAEAMTGIRLAKARHRAGPAELAEREGAGRG
jgi:predicted HD phosphohydrolase